MLKNLPRPQLPPLRWSLVAVIVLLIIFGFSYAGRLIESSELRAQEAQWQEELLLAQAHNQQLREQLAYVQTDAYVVEAGRTRLGWTFPGDVAVWLVGEDAAQPPGEAEAIQPLPSWRLWWRQFFGP